MAISARAAGSWAYANSGTTQTITLPTHAAGDMLIVRYAIKTSAIASTTLTCGTSGWQKLGQYANGTSNSGNGTGSVLVGVFYKEATSAAETNPVITSSQTIAQAGGVAISYQKGSTEFWVTPVGDGGPDTSAGTSHSATIQSHVTATAGDLIDFFTGICDDTTMTVPTFTQSGLTLATVVEYPATAGTDTSGSDGAYDGGYRAVSSGTSSAAAVVTGTLTTSETGTSWTTRLRVTNTQTVTLGLLDASNALYAPTIVPDQLITLPLLAGGDGYREAVLGLGPVGYWRLGESSGTTADNAEGTAAIDGTYVGSPTLASDGLLTGDADTAVVFNGSSQYVSVPDDAAFDLGDVFSVAFLAKVDTGSAYMTAVQKGNSTGRFSIGISRTLWEVQVYISGAANVASANNSTVADTTYHVVVTKNGGSYAVIYIDGADATSTQTTAGTVSNNDLPLYIGAFGGSSEYWDGTLDEVAIFDYALSAAQIAALYDAATTAPSTGATLYAPALEQVSGGTTQSITLGLLDASNALYAPTVLPQPVTVTLDLLDAGAALYAPTLVPKNTLSLDLLDSGSALYAPTLTVGPASFTLPLLDAGAALYAPTLTVGAVTVTLDLLDASNALYAPTLTPAPYPITLGLLDAGAALYAPSVAHAGGAAQTVTLPLLETGYWVDDGWVDGGWVQTGAVLYAPTITPVTLGIVLGLLDGERALYPPILSIGVTLGLLDASNALYAPTLSQVGGGTQSITLALLDAGAALYAPSIAPDQFITLGLLDSGSALYAPTILPQPVGTTLPLLESTPALYAPTLTLAPYPIVLPLLDAGNELFAPAIVGGAVIITLPLLESTPALYAPDLAPDQFVTLGLLDAGPALYAPTLTPQPITTTLPLLDAARALYQPTLVGKNTITLPLLDGERALYDPQVWGAAQSIVVGLLDASGALYAPALTWSNTLVIPFLNAGAELYPPTISSVSALIYGHTRDVNGRVIPFATVDVFVTATNAFYKTTTSDAVGLYQVLVESGVEYFIVAYTAVEFGTSARDLVGV